MTMTKLQLVAQVVGACGMLSLFIMYQQSNRMKYLCFKLLSDVIWTTHYLMLFAIGGAIPNMVGIVRELVFMKEFKNRYTKIIWAAIFITINAGLAILLANSWIQFVPICASALVTISLTFKNTTNIRLLSIPISITFLIYDVFVGSWVGVLNESISLVSMISKTLSQYYRLRAGTKR